MLFTIKLTHKDMILQYVQIYNFVKKFYLENMTFQNVFIMIKLELN